MQGDFNKRNNLWGSNTADTLGIEKSAVDSSILITNITNIGALTRILYNESAIDRISLAILEADLHWSRSSSTEPVTMVNIYCISRGATELAISRIDERYEG